MSVCVIIPARLGSTRFPEKVLAADTGRPLVQHVVDRAKQAKHVREVIVAADDAKIASALKPFGTRVELTRTDHPSGTDRIAEVAAKLDDELIVNVQGDEPEIEPATIERLIERMQSGGEPMATVVTPFGPDRDVNDPNIVKAILAPGGWAIYFSRLPIPFDRDGRGTVRFHHLGIYAYRRRFLLDFAKLAPTPLEQTEKLEQLRAIENGVRIGTVVIEKAPAGIDTIEQYRQFVARHRAEGE